MRPPLGCGATRRCNRKQGADGALPPALVELRKSQLALAREVRRSFRAKWPAFVAAIGAARKLVA